MAMKEQTTKKITVGAKTLAEVRADILAIAKEASADHVIHIEVELDGASYVLYEPFRLSARENPELNNVGVTLKAAPGAHPVLTSCLPVNETCEKVEGKPYVKYRLQKNKNGEYPRFHDLYLGDARLAMAKSVAWTNQEDMTSAERGPGYICPISGTYMSNDFFAPTDRRGLYAPVAIARQVAESESESTELRMYVQWEHYILRVTGVDFSDTKEFNGEAYALITFDEGFAPYFVHGLHRANNTMGRITFFRNDLAFLTEENTYVYDWKNGCLYFIPKEEKVVEESALSYPTLDRLLVFEGMRNVTVEGLIFTGVSSSFPCDNGYYALLSNLERRQKDYFGERLRTAAIVTSGVRRFTVKKCEFRGIGCNGIQMCDRTVQATIRDNVFFDVAMSAISVGNATKEWDQKQNQNIAVAILNNHLEHIAYDYPSSGAIFLGICDGGKVCHNTIVGCGYSGIYGGWGWSDSSYEPGEIVNLRNVEIAYNKIINFMELCRDGAAIYVTGGNAARSYTKRINFMHHNFASLQSDTSKDFNCRGYYLDGSTSNWLLEDNVIDNCLIPLFSQFSVVCQYTYHCTTRNLYSTTPVAGLTGNHRPYHDVLLENCVEVAGLEELFAQYPEAKAIADGAGCKGLF